MDAPDCRKTAALAFLGSVVATIAVAVVVWQASTSWGRHRAIAQFPAFEMWGKPAWWFWLFLHIMYLAGFRNRLSVLIEWGYSYFTYQRGARLITERTADSGRRTGDK